MATRPPISYRAFELIVFLQLGALQLFVRAETCAAAQAVELATLHRTLVVFNALAVVRLAPRFPHALHVKIDTTSTPQTRQPI